MSLVLLELMTTDRNLSGLGIGSSVLTKYIFYKKIQFAVISNSSRICDCLLIKRALIHICLSPIA